MKRALIITYYWPPSGGSGVQRWVKFAKYLPSEGWQCVIYTPENPDITLTDRSLEEEIPSETEIVRTHITEPYAIYRTLLGRKSAAEGGSDEVNPVNAQKKTFKQKAMMFIRGNFFIPDPRCLWIRPSVRFLTAYLREHPVDIIISTGPPHSMHLIARGLARRTGIPWIADFRDPWTEMFYFKHLGLTKAVRRRHLALEQSVLDEATAVVAVSPLVQKDFQARTKTPVHLITNGYDPTDFDNAVVEDDGYFNIVHTGLFASDGNPEVLWQVLSEKCSTDEEFKKMLRIRLVGKTDSSILKSIEAAGLGENLRDFGYRPHEVAVKEQKSASLLILPLRKEPEYKATVPGKVFEYIAARRPILGIGQPDGAMAMILDSVGTGTICDWDDRAGMAACVDRCWAAFLAAANPIKGPAASEVEPEGNPAEDTDKDTAGAPIEGDSAADQAIERYSRKNLTAAMAALMDSLIDK